MTTKKNEPKAAKPAHTPGPWNVKPRSDGYGPMVVDSGGATVVARFYDGVPRNATPANARLIAAAPDLLAALKSLEEGMKSGLFEGKSQDPEWYADKIRAAIAKAEGK